jgi:hypothetical protein
MEAPELQAIREQLAAQQVQRFRIGLGGTAIVSGTLVLTLGPIVWLGWTLLAIGFIAIFTGRPVS